MNDKTWPDDDKTWLDEITEITKNINEKQQIENQLMESFSNAKKEYDDQWKHLSNMLKQWKEKETPISEFKQQLKSQGEIIEKLKKKIDKSRVKLQEQMELNIKFKYQSQVKLAKLLVE